MKSLKQLSLNQMWRAVEDCNPQYDGVFYYAIHRAFKSKVGCTPRVYLEKVRIRTAKELLIRGGISNSEICFAVGFQSLSQFYSIFRKNTGCSPKQYKKMPHKRASDISSQSMS